MKTPENWWTHNENFQISGFFHGSWNLRQTYVDAKTRISSPYLKNLHHDGHDRHAIAAIAMDPSRPPSFAASRRRTAWSKSSREL